MRNHNITPKLFVLIFISLAANLFGAAPVAGTLAAWVTAGAVGQWAGNRLEDRYQGQTPIPSSVQPTIPAAVPSSDFSANPSQMAPAFQQASLAVIGTVAGSEAARAIGRGDAAEAVALTGVTMGSLHAINNPGQGALIAGGSAGAYAAFKRRREIKKAFDDSCVSF